MSWNGERFATRTDGIRYETVRKSLHPTVGTVEEHRESPDQSSRFSGSRSLWNLLREWKWELATWLLGSCALSSIVALLVYYRDRSLKEWSFDVRLATVVAALSQIAQSALLVSVSACIGQLKWEWLRKKQSTSDLRKFEEASRGPHGSLMLLPRTKFHLVSVGALATILLLAFSPFTQQSNTIHVRSVGRTGPASNATISRSVYYLNYDSDTSLVPKDESPLFNTSKRGPGHTHPHMFKALLAGMLDGNKTLSDVQGDCSAEACEWDNYTTLAICNTIEDISSSVELRNDTARISGTSWEPPKQPYTLDSFWMAAPYNELVEVKDEKLPAISNMFIAYFPPCNHQNQTWGDSRNEDRLVPSNWKAYKATLSLCLQTLNSSLNNTMETRIIDTRRDLKWTLASKPFPVVCLTQPYDGLEFCVGQDDFKQWSSVIQRTWEGAALLQEGADNYYTGQWVPNIVGDILGPTPAGCDSNLGPGYGYEGFTRRVDNIAISMSNALRTGNLTSADSFVKGSEWNTEQYIEVDFVWLTLPGAVYLVITLFFLATMAGSRRGDRPLWKSSPLVLLQVADRNNGMNTLKRVEKEASRTQVQLQYTGENWHLQRMAR